MVVVHGSRIDPLCNARLARDGAVPYYNLANCLPLDYVKAHSATLIVRVSGITSAFPG